MTTILKKSFRKKNQNSSLLWWAIMHQRSIEDRTCASSKQVHVSLILTRRIFYGAGRLNTATFVQGPGIGEIGEGKKELEFTQYWCRRERPSCKLTPQKCYKILKQLATPQCIFLPKFHWVLLGSRQSISSQSLWLHLQHTKKNLPKSLASVERKTVRLCEHLMIRWMEAYRSGLGARKARMKVKKFSSRIPQMCPRDTSSSIQCLKRRTIIYW